MRRSAAINSISRPVANVLAPASSSMWARIAMLLRYRGVPIKSRSKRSMPKCALELLTQPNRLKSIRVVCHDRRVSIWFATIREIIGMRLQPKPRGGDNLRRRPLARRICPTVFGRNYLMRMS